jgi:hypothetical protein
MKALVEIEDNKYVEEERGEPMCGAHFCDACGDCLACSDTCFIDEKRVRDSHIWVIYRM